MDKKVRENAYLKRKVLVFMKRNAILFLTAVLTFSAILFCGIGAEAASNKQVKINKTKTVLEMGSTDQLEIMNAVASKGDSVVTESTASGAIKATKTTVAADTPVVNKNVKWSSSNKKIVKVGKDGVITPVAVGAATITGKYNGKKYSCRVTVIDYEGMSDEQKDVISYALKYVGNPYRYGGISLTKGTDCSGFTHSVYKKFGYNLFHNAYQQMVDTKKVKMKDIQPGDLIFYGSSKSSCSHVALYIGNGKVVHASTPSTGIVVSDYNYRKTCGVGRVLKTATYPDQNTDQNSTDVNDNVTAYAKKK